MQVQSRWITVSSLLFFAALLSAQPQDMLNRAEALTEKSQYQFSNQLLEEFIATYPRREYDLGDAYYQQSLNYYQLGMLGKAATSNDRSTQIRLAFGAESLGQNYLQDGRIAIGALQLPEALASFKLADQFPFIDDPLLTAELQRLISRVYTIAGRPDLALYHNNKALDILSVLAGEEDEAYEKVLLERARLQQSTNPDSAFILLTGLVDASPNAAHHQAMGDYYVNQKDWAAATGQYQQAYTRTSSDEVLRKAELLLRLGQLALRQGQPATDYTRQCMERLYPGFESQSAAGLPKDGLIILDTALMIQALQLKAEQHLSNYRSRGQADELEQAVAAARLGIELLEETMGHYQDYPLRKRELIALLPVFEPLLYALSTQGNASSVLEQMDRMVQWQSYLSGLQEDISDVKQDTLQQGLEEGQALLSYHCGEQYIMAAAMNFTNTATAVIPVVNEDGLGLTDAVAQFKRAIAEEDGADFSALGHTLYQQLLSPLHTVTEEASNLQIYRNGVLQELPFEALLVKAPKKRRQDKYHRMDFLGEAAAITYSTRPAQVLNKGVLQLAAGLVVNPGFEGEAGQLDAVEQLMAGLWSPEVTNEQGQITDKPATVAVSGMAYYLKDAEATATQVKESLPPYSSLIISAPFVERQDSPAESAYLLAQEPDVPRNGIWKLGEWSTDLSGKGLVLIGEPNAFVAKLAGTSTLLFAQAEAQPLLETLAGEYDELPLAKAVQALRQDKAKKRSTAAPKHWLGLWVVAP